MPLKRQLVPLNPNEIRDEVARVLDALPRRFRKHLNNLEIVVEERPARELLLAQGLDPRVHTLFGLYQGVPLPQRSALYPPVLPDKITIFSEPLARRCATAEELREQIRATVLHEIAHYFGMDDAQIEKLGY